jgi:hypothetical protein
MICAFCSTHIDEKNDAIEAGWWPDFYSGQQNYEGPVCPVCTSKFLFLDENGEMELQPGVKVPPLAIPLQRRPNMNKNQTRFPPIVNHDGKLYVRTGKTGRRFVDGIWSCEYEADDASRLWLGADGKIILD